MEDSLLLQSLTTNPSGTASSFPLYRRRPLRSRTYDTLIRILSHCRPQLHVRGPACEEDRLITQSQVISTDELELHPKSKGSEEKVVREASDAEANENIGFQDFDGNPATTSNLHQPGLVRDNEKELVSSNEIRIDDYLVVEEKAADCVVQNTKELDNVNGVLDIQMDDFGTLEDVELDENLCFHRLNEVLDSCLDLDMVDKSSEARQLSKEKGIVSEENMAKGVEYELQMKEVELEKLVYSSGNTDAPICENGGDIEEGEISGDAGIVDESFNTLSEGAVLEEEAAENLHASEGYIDKDKLLLEDKERGRQLLGMTDPSMGNIVDIESNPKNVKNNMPARQLQDYHDLDVLRGSHVKTRKSTPHSLDNPTPPGRILQANAAENQISMTTEKDEDASTRKRKRSLTKERRAKKKKKERIKRAEKNRELGVKRLKLPTIVKPKKIVYCRHYLQGRCHEGEKCKFSHDTVPLTKSKPCGHFARHSCLKGDDCPFDHQLSKYPCNNYTSNGFCNRGSECMFSHEMPATSPSATPSVSKHDLISPHKTVPEKGPHPMSTVNKSGLKSPSPLNNPSSSCDTSHQKVNSRLGYAANSAGQREQLTLKPVPGSGGRAPRGVSFLLNGALSLGDTGKEKQDWSPAQRTDAVGAGCKETLKEPGAVNELNEMSEGVAPRKPRGINFLSFGQPPSNDSSSKILSDLLSKYNEGTGKSAIDDVGKGKGKASLDSSKGDTAFSFVKEAQGTSELQATFGTPSSSSPGKNANLSSSFNAFSFVKEAQGTSELQATIGTPLSSSPGKNANLSSSFKTVFLSNTPSLVRKAVQSTLAFAAQLEPDIKVGSSYHQ